MNGVPAGGCESQKAWAALRARSFKDNAVHALDKEVIRSRIEEAMVKDVV